MIIILNENPRGKSLFSFKNNTNKNEKQIIPSLCLEKLIFKCISISLGVGGPFALGWFHLKLPLN